MSEADHVYRSVFGPLADRLEKIPHAAFADLAEWIPEAERGAMFVIPRANFIQWRMIIHAQNTFGTNGPVRMVKDSDGMHFLYIENGNAPYGVEFGKACNGLCRGKNSNPKNSAMLGQMTMPFYEDEPKRFNLVHTVEGEGLAAGVGRVALTMESDHGIEWRWVLSDSSEGNMDDGFDIPIRPADPSDGPVAPIIIAKPHLKKSPERKRNLNA